ncbi:MAG: hypothetical protein KDB62_07610 [Solirubrobacterales bacterium]|nr:hypothetical protein [Solirubrobacterales bacterium]
MPEAWKRRYLDPLIEFKADPRLVFGLLGLATLASLVYCLWATRGSTFSGDELTWVTLSPQMDLGQALEPHSGHLVLVSHLLYAWILDTLGSNYVIFRLLTLATVYISVWLLFFWARKRVGDFLALAPCVVLLFFGTDTGHLLQGNGFTIMLAVACGMAALLALERDSRSGDLVACLALCLGVVTYTVVLAFLVGATAAVLLSRRRWSRIWVVAIPIAIYLGWRLWIVVADVGFARGGVEPGYIFLLPSWTFQSLSGILNALSGLHLNFGGSGWLPPGEMAGPTLAVIFVVAIGWRISIGRLTTWFWVAMAVALAMFASQVLSWIPDVREPGTSRYIFPGAFVVLLVMIEAARGYRPNRTAFVAIWLIALTGLATNAAIIKDSGDALRARGPMVRAEVTAATLLGEAFPYLPGPSAKPLSELVSAPGIATILEAEQKYGGLAFSPSELTSQSDPIRIALDSIIAQAYGFTLIPYQGDKPTGCAVAKAGPDGLSTAPIPEKGAILTSKTGGAVTIRRFGSAFSNTVGELPSVRPMTLNVPQDSNPTPWQIAVQTPRFSVCPTVP